MRNALTVPRFIDDISVFHIYYDDEHGVYRAEACSRELRRWVQVRSSNSFDELYHRCMSEGMSYYGATDEALYRYQFGLPL